MPVCTHSHRSSNYWMQSKNLFHVYCHVQGQFVPQSGSVIIFCLWYFYRLNSNWNLWAAIPRAQPERIHLTGKISKQHEVCLRCYMQKSKLLPFHIMTVPFQQSMEKCRTPKWNNWNSYQRRSACCRDWENATSSQLGKLVIATRQNIDIEIAKLLTREKENLGTNRGSVFLCMTSSLANMTKCSSGAECWTGVKKI